MEVTVLRATDRPERLVCQAARGDYFDGFVGATDYEQLMRSVDWDEDDLAAVKEIRDPNFPKSEEYWEQEAATYAFVNKQLARGHFGPWEHPQITFAVKGVSRVTMAQITRHRHMTFDVQSQRYVDFADKESIIPKSLLDSEHFSRNEGLVELDDIDRSTARDSYQDHAQAAFEWYEDMVDAGVPKEDARFVLPLGTPVNMTFSGNARTMMHVLNLRQKANAQWEVRELADRVADKLEQWAPYTGHWWRENGPVKISP